eukprot:GHVL01021710.1.p1 GENE.GHVL01021710.1~~GHVL01021710.1.p1  ORF type:complete len:796 (+),score=202.60 GHVL01021710.1:44-2431(+)
MGAKRKNNLRKNRPIDEKENVNKDVDEESMKNDKKEENLTENLEKLSKNETIADGVDKPKKKNKRKNKKPVSPIAKSWNELFSKFEEELKSCKNYEKFIQSVMHEVETQTMQYHEQAQSTRQAAAPVKTEDEEAWVTVENKTRTPNDLADFFKKWRQKMLDLCDSANTLLKDLDRRSLQARQIERSQMHMKKICSLKRMDELPSEAVIISKELDLPVGTTDSLFWPHFLSNKLEKTYTVIIERVPRSRLVKVVGLSDDVERAVEALKELDLSSEVSFPIDENSMGTIIGKGGATVQKIEKDFKVYVLLTKSECLVKGAAASVAGAKKNILQLIQDAEAANHSETFSIPESFVKWVLKETDAINKTETVTNTVIKCTISGGEVSKVTINGDKTKVAEAKSLLDDEMKSLTSEKISVSPSVLHCLSPTSSVWYDDPTLAAPMKKLQETPLLLIIRKGEKIVLVGAEKVVSDAKSQIEQIEKQASLTAFSQQSDKIGEKMISLLFANKRQRLEPVEALAELIFDAPSKTIRFRCKSENASASKDKVEKAMNALKELMEDLEAQLKTFISKNHKIEKSDIRTVIGTKGVTIKRLRDESKCEKFEIKEDGTVILNGPPPSVEKAIILIDKIIEENRAARQKEAEDRKAQKEEVPGEAPPPPKKKVAPPPPPKMDTSCQSFPSLAESTNKRAVVDQAAPRKESAPCEQESVKDSEKESVKDSEKESVKDSEKSESLSESENNTENDESPYQAQEADSIPDVSHDNADSVQEEPSPSVESGRKESNQCDSVSSKDANTDNDE